MIWDLKHAIPENIFKILNLKNLEMKAIRSILKPGIQICIQSMETYGCQPKNRGVFTPQIIPFVHGVFHEIFTIHFGGFKIPQKNWFNS